VHIKDEKELIDFYHYNTTNYHDQLKFKKGSSYGYSNNINLEEHPNDIINDIEFKDILPNLSSKRNMSLDNPLDRNQLLNLLYNSYRFKNKKSLKSPSPGAMYPLELYVIVKNVKNIEKGTYYYNREEISLNYINDFYDIHSLNVPNNDFTRNVGCMIFFVCNIENLIKKYGARAYRYCLIECGHVGQNISIVSHMLNIKSCAIGGFYDSKVRNHLNLSDNFYPLYSYVLG
jgi:SagB-type dehydrogenase family enzyme